ncbi:MAG: small basic protein [Candidatus Omnitrophota bacterium]|nr:small basic protein [Candidatus Omnitrophota bacterium]
MSQHGSLRVDSVGKKHRNVFKRLERIKRMQEQNRFADNRSIYNLPKIKSIKIKVKATAVKAAEGEAGAAGAAGAAAPALPGAQSKEKAKK